MTIITKPTGKPVIGLLAVLGLAAYILTGCPPDSGGDSATVTGVTVTPQNAAVAKDKSLKFTAKVEGTGGFDNTVTWKLEGGTAGTSINPNTGLLKVAKGETAETLIVLAVSNADASKSDTVNVSVTEVTGVTIKAKTLSVIKSGTLQLSAVVAGTGSYTYDQTVTWTLSGEEGETSIDPNTGLLKVGADETAETLTVTAKSKADSSKSGTVEIIVIEVTGVTVSPPNPTVAKGSAQKFTAVVAGTPQEGLDQSVEWSVSPKDAGTAIDANGLLTVAAGETAAIVTVTAASKANPAKSGKATVAVGNDYYTVKFETGNFGRVNPAALNVKKNTPIVEPVITDLEDYPYITFGGWFKDSSFTSVNKWDFTKEVTGDMTLYAKWSDFERGLQDYTIEFISVSPNIQIPSKHYNRETEDFDLPKPAHSNYIFLNWHEESSGGPVKTKIEKGSIGNKKFYAEWTPSGERVITYYWLNEQDNLRLSVSQVSVSSAGSITIAPQAKNSAGDTVSAQTNGYTIEKWYLNGAVIKNSDVTPPPSGDPNAPYAGTTYTFVGSDNDPDARHTVGLRVKKGGQYYHAEIQITIQ